MEESSNVSNEDLQLVKTKEIARERLTCVNDGGKPLELGSGFFGSVFKGFLATDSGGKLPVAIKVLKSTSVGVDYGHFIEEAATLIRSEGHENIISLIGTCITDSLAEENTAGLTPKIPILVMELADGGNLHAYLKQCREQLSQRSPLVQEDYQSTANLCELVSICHQAALGMKHLSAKKILHRDLAARNILLTKDKVVKIGDFGLSKHLIVKNYYKICSRLDKPVKWTSPEALLLDRYTVSSDVWSFGVLMWEVFSLGAEPYPTIQPRNLYLFLRKGGRLPCPEKATNRLFQCMLSCWIWKPERRPSFIELEKELRMIHESSQENISEKSGTLPDFYCHQVQGASVQSNAKPPSIKLVNQNSSSDSDCSLNSSDVLSQVDTCSSEIAAKCETSFAAKSTQEVQNRLNPRQSDSALPEAVDSCVSKHETLEKSAMDSDYFHTVEDEDTYISHKVACNLKLKPNSRSSLHNSTRRPTGVRNCWVFENQSYQSRKTQSGSSRSSTESGSGSSNPTDNEIEERTSETKLYFHVFGSYLLEKT